MSELLEILTTDGVKLHGALHAPVGGDPPRGFDAALLLHGTGGNFYGSSLWNGLLPGWRQAGWHVAAVNTRGHDLIYATTVQSERRLLGSAYEVVDDCRYDVAGWLDALAARGFPRVLLVGHSLGAVKAAYSQGIASHPAVVGVVAISPPRLSHRLFLERGARHGFEVDFRRAQAAIEAGRGEELLEVRFPLPYSISARGFVDKYGPDERYELLKFAGSLRVPSLFTFGGAELSGGAFRGSPEALESLTPAGSTLDVAVVAGADHMYSGCYSELGQRLEGWIRKRLSP